MARVVLKDLVKIYPGKSGAGAHAVNRINLTIENGEFMVLVGPSGCGKSTTLRMIAGLEEITSGTIAIDGQVVNEVLPKDRDIAMVFQNYALYPHMSVYDNMGFGLKLRGIARPEIDARVREAAAMLRLEPLLDRRPKALSGGQRQRVAVGRALVRKPKVFLFDEPLSNLDAKMRATTRTELSKLHARLGVTMIYVTHDQVEAMTMGDRICVLNEGSVMQVADPLTVYGEPANVFVGGFIGSPPMNLFHGTIERVGDSVAFVEAPSSRGGIRFGLTPRLAAQAAHRLQAPAILGIRPENIHDLRVEPASTPAGAAPVKVELAEPMGAETYLHLHSGATPFVARARPVARYAIGQTLAIGFDLEKAHLFDPATGAAWR